MPTNAWTHAEDGDAGNGLNWSLGHRPISTEDVTMTGSVGSVDSNSFGAMTWKSLTIDDESIGNSYDELALVTVDNGAGAAVAISGGPASIILKDIKGTANLGGVATTLTTQNDLCTVIGTAPSGMTISAGTGTLSTALAGVSLAASTLGASFTLAGAGTFTNFTCAAYTPGVATCAQTVAGGGSGTVAFEATLSGTKSAAFVATDGHIGAETLESFVDNGTTWSGVVPLTAALGSNAIELIHGANFVQVSLGTITVAAAPATTIAIANPVPIGTLKFRNRMPSPPIALELSGDPFGGTDTITLSCDNGTIEVDATGTVSGNESSNVTVTPSADQTGFTYRVTPSLSGIDCTITYTNGQGWTDPDPLVVPVTRLRRRRPSLR